MTTFIVRSLQEPSYFSFFIFWIVALLVRIRIYNTFIGRNGFKNSYEENNFKERYVKISCERINEIYQSAKKKVKAMENDTQKQRML